MKPKAKERGFSIIELLTVLSIITILISLLVPSLNAVRRYSKNVTQKGQFHKIAQGLEMFGIDRNGYPGSAWNEIGTADSYCGAMKLCEAMVGQDGLGFHPDSRFDDSGQTATGSELYYNRTTPPTPPYSDDEQKNLRARKLYVEGDDIQIASLETLFGTGNTGVFDANCVMLCDVFKRTELKNDDGTKLGMPVLYYKADTSKLTHDPSEASTNIYSYWDNHELLGIPVPWAPLSGHPLYDASASPPSEGGPVFYNNTKDDAVTVIDRPHNIDSYILISAGWDGIYGTRDDVYNFED